MAQTTVAFNEPTLAASGNASSMAELRALFERHAPGDGFFPAPIAGLQLIRASAPSEPLSVMYRPALCVVLSGRKRVFLNDQITEYGSNDHLVISQDLPVFGQVIEATPLEPYLCVHLRIEHAEINQLVLDHGLPQEPAGATAHAARGLYVEPSTAALMDAILRLVRLLDSPADLAAIAPLVRREIVYRLMSSPNGWRIARTAKADCYDQRIARVLAVLRARFREPIGVPELADIAHLSPSALHLHFKTVTSFTPLQYVKQLRLQEARRLLVTTDMDAAAVAFTIGYESPSQFSREYARMFGEPPVRDRARLLGTAVVYALE
ncbi:MAG: AraC family transcriptional regulator N-terminal domain-containing protein [Hydrogenophaga sp.]|uniref:AraC family transcriptional regulator n=1 Tax=Hydrogenophaga intermedia TaxID=65786 RepID=UPI0020435E08|nr:AraC family transcriptional regulator [Hydrogenophaga intermedia]MCM3564766.1 AraC family transcriptional regulator [Hydrogenophaga intermedia]